MVTAAASSSIDVNSLVMQVNLFVSARKLRDMDAFSKSDPMCFLYEHTGIKGKKN